MGPLLPMPRGSWRFQGGAPGLHAQLTPALAGLDGEKSGEASWCLAGRGARPLWAASCFLFSYDGAACVSARATAKLRPLRPPVHSGLLRPGPSPLSTAEQLPHRLPYAFLYYYFLTRTCIKGSISFFLSVSTAEMGPAAECLVSCPPCWGGSGEARWGWEATAGVSWKERE